jgi:hypothetical protein
MTDITRELLPEHPIAALRATETDHAAGIHNGEILAFRCLECGAADEDVAEIIHEGDCQLVGQTKPTAYADRLSGPLSPREAATDGGYDPD